MTIVENKPFVSVDFDPDGKGNDLIIKLDEFAHIVNVPVELYIIENSNGVVSALEVVDQNGDITYLRLL